MPYWKRLNRQRESVVKTLLGWMLSASDDYVVDVIYDALDKGYKAYIVIEAPVGDDLRGVTAIAPILGRGCYADLEASKELICN